MSHELHRLSKSLLEKPQLITPEKFQEISEYLEDRNVQKDLTKFRMEYGCGDDDKKEYKEDLVETNVGILRVEGPTTYRPTGWEALCGGTSYKSLLEDMEYLCQQTNIEKILMLVDSPGGEAYRCFETSRELRNKANKYGKKLIGYIDGLSASAGYGLAAACDELIINPDAEAGSIGVVVRLVNYNKAMDAAGIETKYITAGKSKIPFDEDGGFKDEFIANLQSRVDELYDNFVSHVSTMRGISESTVRDTEAKVFSAKDCLSLGLVDKVMEAEEFYEYLTSDTSGEKPEEPEMEGTSPSEESPDLQTQNSTTNGAKMSKENLASTVDAAKFAEMEAKLAQYEAKEQEQKKASLSTLVESAKLSNKDKIVEAMFSNEEVNTLMTSVITDIKTNMAEMQAGFDTEMSAVKEAHQAELSEITTKMEKAAAEVNEVKTELEQVKTEFSVPAGLEGGNESLEDTKVDARKSSALAQFIAEKHSK